MMKKNLIVSATLITLALASSVLGQPRRKRPKTNPPSSAAAIEVNTSVKPKTQKPFRNVEGIDSETEKSVAPAGNQPIVVGSARARQAKAAQSNLNSTLTPAKLKAKKPGRYIGGSEDGQSIRRKQPRKRRD